MTNPEVRRTPQDAGFPFLVKIGSAGSSDKSITISTGEKRPLGYLEARFTPGSRELEIREVKNEASGRGNTKAMLERALREAKDMQAVLIRANITDVSVRDSMGEVFGQESVRILSNPMHRMWGKDVIAELNFDPRPRSEKSNAPIVKVGKYL